MASVFGFGLFSHGVLSSFLPVRRFSSGAAPLSRFAASLLSCFSEGHSLFLLFRVRLYSFLIPHLNAFSLFDAHLRLNRIRCRRVSGLFFPAIFTKGAVLIYLYCLWSEPASARIDAPTVTLYPIRWNPACRLSVEPEHFTALSFICIQSMFSVFSKPMCLPRALPQKGVFFAL